MSDAWALKLAAIAGVLIAAVVTGALVALFRWFTWWPTLLLQTLYRPGLIFTRILLVMFFTAAVPIVVLPAGLGVGVMVLLWLTAVPGLTERWVRAAAWKRDKPKDRSEAAAIRLSILARRGDDRTFDAAKPWPEYIVDIARLQRRRRYRPPGD